MPGGRPSAYKPEYCAKVVEWGKQGYSPAQMCSEMDVARSTIDEWALKYPEFSEAFTRAKAHAQAWWEKTGQEAMFLPGFNAAVWKKSMEARFREDYTERKIEDVTLRANLAELTDEQLLSIAGGAGTTKT